jgi:hypothetical protein
MACRTVGVAVAGVGGDSRDVVAAAQVRVETVTAQEHLERGLATLATYRAWVEQPPNSKVRIEATRLRAVEADLADALAILLQAKL